MEEISKIHVGLDTSKERIAVGVAPTGREPGKFLSEIAHDVAKLVKLVSRLGPPEQLHLVYEAGPTGYGLQRALAARGYACEIIAPSKIPRRPADRVKTDRRDCVRLAELSRAGELKPIYIPDPRDEAIRDLTRAREDAVNARTKARQQLSGFLLRHDIRYAGKTAWCKMHANWMATLTFDEGAAQTAFTEYWLAVKSADERVERLTAAVIKSICGWRSEATVNALQAMRGVAAITSIGLVAEVGDMTRFEHPRKFMGYLGLVPSENSSGERTSRGSITKTGNGHARRLLVEAAWNYRYKARVSPKIHARQEGLSEAICATAWKAQKRLTERFSALDKRGLQRNKACVAVARELAGFVWAMAIQAQKEAPQRAPQAA